jgi:dUTPase
MSSLILYIEPAADGFAELYHTAANTYNSTPMPERNSGFDLYCDARDIDDTYSTHCLLVSQGCRAAAYDEHGRRRAFWLAPRSSISRTPFTLANSLGLIDAGYRGVIKAALRTNGAAEYTLEAYQRLTQLAAPDLLPWFEVRVVDRLPDAETARGAGGFGSTGTGISDSRDGNGFGSTGTGSTGTGISDSRDGNGFGSTGTGSTGTGAGAAAPPTDHGPTPTVSGLPSNSYFS